MKTKAVIFTCSAHIEAAKIAAEAASRFYDIVVAIDEKDDIGPVNWAEHETTGFERGGNLNGYECAKGVAEVLLRHAKNGFVVKIDSDTVVKTSDGFVGYDIAGYVQPLRPPALLGCYYSISERALVHALACIKRCPYFGIKRYPEDATITSFAQTLAKDNFKSNIFPIKRLGVWNPSMAPNLKSKVGNFGTFSKKGNWCHEESLAAMRKFANS
jgi:hypothetical protein